MNAWLPTLAQDEDFVKLVIYGIVIALGAAGWLGKTLKQYREGSKAGKTGGAAGGAPGAAPDQRQTAAQRDRQARLEELAARRRAQLQQMTQQRRQASDAQPSDGLTMADRIRKARQQGTPPTQPQRDATAQSAQRERAARVEELRRRRVQQEQLAARRAAEQREHLEQQRRAAAGRERAAMPAPVPVAGRRKLGDGATLVAATHDQTVGEVHRHVTDADQPIVIKSTGIKLSRLDRSALRQAIVLNEVLGKPVSLREPIA